LKASREARRRDDSGSAIVEFVLVSVLVVVIALALLQLALTLHVRNIVMSSASEGARFAALADRSLADGERRTAHLIDAALSGYSVDIASHETTINGAPAVSIVVTAPVPVIGVWGIGEMTIEGRAYQETYRG